MVDSVLCPSCGFPSSVAVAGPIIGIKRCVRCGLRFIEKPQSADTIDYNTLYTQDGLYGAHIESVRILSSGGLIRLGKAKRQALATLKKTHRKKLLEIGCGVGAFLAPAEHIGIECFGIDISAEAISRAKEYLHSKLEVGIIQKNTFAGVTFDSVCMWEVLEHLPDPFTTITNVFEKLAAGGVFMLSTPNYGSHWIWRDMPSDSRSRPPVHVTFWNKRSLGMFLKRCGFSKVRVGYTSVPYSAAVRQHGSIIGIASIIEAAVIPPSRSTLFAMAIK